MRNPPLVLVVEDYTDALELYQEYLEFAGLRVITARNGLEAVARASEHRPDLIVMDIALPFLDGLEATRRIRADERTRTIPIVGLTGTVVRGAEREARAAGCDQFVTKPCLPEELMRHVRDALAAAAARRGQES
jgi:CheY-like chemotaxis protein